MRLSRDSTDFCWQFLHQSVALRRETLQKLGLERYQQLLCHLPPTNANQLCLRRFLADARRVKFPQLQGADLADLDLQGMNLIRAKFNNAQLQRCCLQSADLIFADFTGADLSDADLRHCTLHESQWTNTIVIRCDLRGTVGLTSQQQQILSQAGAILD